MLKRTDSGVYYIHDYIPQYLWNSKSFEETEISQRLVRYKDEGKTVALNKFTDDLKDALVVLSKELSDKNIKEIALFAVPPSKIDKYCPMRISISHIAEDNKLKLNNINNIMDCSNVLIRTKDVNTSHSKENRRAYKYEHVLSIDSTVDDFTDWPDNRAYLILDDITTSGIQMNVCREVLIDNYANEDNIYMLAIGATIR